MRHIIIGDGATGTTAAYYIRAAEKGASITIVSDDPNPAYYRAALTNYLLGELQESQLFAVPPDFYIVNGIDRILARVSAVDVKNNKVTLADGREIEYDRLLIASGSRPNTPTFPGAELSGEQVVVNVALHFRHLPPYFVRGLEDYYPEGITSEILLQNMTVIDMADATGNILLP